MATRSHPFDEPYRTADPGHVVIFHVYSNTDEYIFPSKWVSNIGFISVHGLNEGHIAPNIFPR